MNYAHLIRVKENQSIYNISNREYLVEITWSKKPFDDYKKLAGLYAQCGYLVLKEVIESGHNNVKSDMWFFPGVFFLRQSIELELKCLICRVYSNKHDIQNIFKECCHDLYLLYSKYTESSENYLTEDENQWIERYLESLEEVDQKSDIFRFPFEMDFLAKYKDKFIDNVVTANNMIQAFSIIKKCINCGTYDDNRVFNSDYEPDFLILAHNGIGNCYLWEPISDNGFHSKIMGYISVADFLFYRCVEMTNEEKFYPLIFLLRNTIELCLKRLFYASVDNGVSRHTFASKKRSHLLKKDLWKNVRPMIQFYADKTNADLSVIDIVEREIIEIDLLDKKGDVFRYPTSYSLQYRVNNMKFDVKNVFEFYRGIINFLDGCDAMLDEIADCEAEMQSDYW